MRANMYDHDPVLFTYFIYKGPNGKARKRSPVCFRITIEPGNDKREKRACLTFLEEGGREFRAARRTVDGDRRGQRNGCVLAVV